MIIIILKTDLKNDCDMCTYYGHDACMKEDNNIIYNCPLETI